MGPCLETVDEAGEGLAVCLLGMAAQLEAGSTPCVRRPCFVPSPFLRLVHIHRQGNKNRFSRLQLKQMKSLLDAVDLH